MYNYVENAPLTNTDPMGLNPAVIPLIAPAVPTISTLIFDVMISTGIIVLAAGIFDAVGKIIKDEWDYLKDKAESLTRRICEAIALGKFQDCRDRVLKNHNPYAASGSDCPELIHTTDASPAIKDLTALVFVGREKSLEDCEVEYGKDLMKCRGNKPVG